MNKKQNIIVVAGPTSSGKSDFAVHLALSKKSNEHPFVDGEIISCDSRQLYRGLDIGTGKITQEEMKGVPHHMIDIYDIEDHTNVSVTTFRDIALPIIEDILARGKTPILCGGTGQYIDALIYTTEIPKIAPNELLRASLSLLSSEELYAQLKKRDPHRAKTIDKDNKRRLVRALEIVEALGKVPTQEEGDLRFHVDFYLLSPSKELLEKRVYARLLKRFDLGMIQEVKNLLQQGHSSSDLSLCGIEYKWIIRYINKEISYDDLITRLRIATWQYAKRQRTWNKKYEKDTRIHLIKIDIVE